MNEPTYSYILKQGLWHNNAGLVQLLGLCPLLAITTSVINGLGLGIATMLTLVASNVIVSLIRILFVHGRFSNNIGRLNSPRW